jgi:hypothetical protein
MGEQPHHAEAHGTGAQEEAHRLARDAEEVEDRFALGGLDDGRVPDLADARRFCAREEGLRIDAGPGEGDLGRFAQEELPDRARVGARSGVAGGEL